MKNWQGWEPESGLTKAGYFKENDPSRTCDVPCEKCGFYYLNTEGGPLNTGAGGAYLMNDKPMCGKW